MKIRVLETTEELERLRPEWASLFERDPNATPFQSPEWLLPWWRHIGRGRLFTCAVYGEERLIALAPFHIGRYWGTPLRHLALLGTGNTDYLDGLFDPAHASEAAGLILEELARHRSRWDFCDFQQFRSTSPLLAASRPPELSTQAQPQEVCPVLELSPPSHPEPTLREVLPKRIAKNLRHYQLKLEHEPGARIELATRETLDEHLHALFTLHQTRWRRRGLPGTMGDPRVQAFHREVALGFLERGWLRLYGLRIEGRLRASLYCFQYGRRTYYYSGGFDPEIARLSPGTLLIGQAIEDALARGDTEFDFLRGSEAYKYSWGAVDRQNYRRVLWREGFPSAMTPRVIRWENKAEHALKQLADGLTQAEARRRTRSRE